MKFNPLSDDQFIPPSLTPSLEAAAKEIMHGGPPLMIAFMSRISELAVNQPQWEEFASLTSEALFEELEDEMTSESGSAAESLALDNGLIYKVKITLNGVRPSIFREIEVPNLTLGELHDVIQTAMGWGNCHMHAFKLKHRHFGPQNDFEDPDLLDEDSMSLQNLVDEDERKFIYEYDFGDSWEHDILISKPTAPKPKETYPRCLKGELACPPEDCGGIWGYLEICRLLNTPKCEWNDDEKGKMTWLGKYDPHQFSVDAVTKSMRKLFSGGVSGKSIAETKPKNQR